MCCYRCVLPSPTFLNHAATAKTYRDEQNNDGDGSDKADDKLGRPICVRRHTLSILRGRGIGRCELRRGQ